MPLVRVGAVCVLWRHSFTVRNTQSKSDALGDGAGATAGEGEGDEDDEDEDVTGGDGGGGGGVSAAAATSAAAAGEEDLAEKEAEDEADDGTIAFECLDTARYIYERQPRNEVGGVCASAPRSPLSRCTAPCLSACLPAPQTRDAALHKVRIRLGDAFVEAEEFTAAAAEYRAALLLLDGAPPTDRRLPAVLEAMGQVRRWRRARRRARSPP